MISASELRNVMTQFGEKLSEDEVEQMMVVADRGCTGEVHWQGTWLARQGMDIELTGVGAVANYWNTGEAP